jgi:hypothetical protein
MASFFMPVCHPSVSSSSATHFFKENVVLRLIACNEEQKEGYIHGSKAK